MTDIRRQLDQLVKKELTQTIIPVKTDEGILVGSILIISEGSVKHLKRQEEILYENISLNVSAIAIANLLTRYKTHITADKIYREDQEYAKWFIDAQFLLKRYYWAKNNQDFDRADMFWARYCESRDKAQISKNRVSALTLF